MGLRLLAHYFDCRDALIAKSVVDAAGLFVVLHGYEVLAIQPYYVGPFGGYRLMVSEFDLYDAAAVLKEATANPIVDGEVLLTEADLLNRVLSVFVGWMNGGAPMVIRGRSWASDKNASEDMIDRSHQ